MDKVLTNAERAIIDKHLDEIFDVAMMDTIDCFMAKSDFYSTLAEIAVECESSIDGAQKLIKQDVCDGEQYFYTQLEKKFENTVIVGVKFAKKA